MRAGIPAGFIFAAFLHITLARKVNVREMGRLGQLRALVVQENTAMQASRSSAEYNLFESVQGGYKRYVKCKGYKEALKESERVVDKIMDRLGDSIMMNCKVEAEDPQDGDEDTCTDVNKCVKGCSGTQMNLQISKVDGKFTVEGVSGGTDGTHESAVKLIINPSAREGTRMQDYFNLNTVRNTFIESFKTEFQQIQQFLLDSYPTVSAEFGDFLLKLNNQANGIR